MKKIYIIISIVLLVFSSCEDFIESCCTGGHSLSHDCSTIYINGNCSDGSEPSDCYLPKKIRVKWRETGTSNWEELEHNPEVSSFGYEIENLNSNSEYEVIIQAKRVWYTNWRNIESLTISTDCSTNCVNGNSIRGYVSGDYDGDGKEDNAWVYYYGNNQTTIHTFLSDGTKFNYQGDNGWWTCDK